ncbi:hypothetical protein ACTXT7_002327 [Hymenolepis weldensis]
MQGYSPEWFKKLQSNAFAQIEYQSKPRPSQPVPVGLSHNTVDKWEISKSSVVLKERIGKGQFGEVYRAVWNGTTLVAVKTLRASLLKCACDSDLSLVESL